MSVSVVLRVMGSVAALVGASWLAVNWLDERLTARIIASTDEAMRHPTVQREVDALLSRTAHRLLSEPSTEPLIAEFLTSMAKQAELEEGSLHILAGTLLSEQFKKAGVEIMKELTLLVLQDSIMREKLGTLSTGVSTELEEVAMMERLVSSLRPQMPTILWAQRYERPTAEFTKALELLRDRMRKEEIKDEIESMRVEVALPNLQLPGLFAPAATAHFLI